MLAFFFFLQHLLGFHSFFVPLCWLLTVFESGWCHLSGMIHYIDVIQALKLWHSCGHSLYPCKPVGRFWQEDGVMNVDEKNGERKRRWQKDIYSLCGHVRDAVKSWWPSLYKWEYVSSCSRDGSGDKPVILNWIRKKCYFTTKHRSLPSLYIWKHMSTSLPPLIKIFGLDCAYICFGSKWKKCETYFFEKQTTHIFCCLHRYDAIYCISLCPYKN